MLRQWPLKTEEEEEEDYTYYVIARVDESFVFIRPNFITVSSHVTLTAILPARGIGECLPTPPPHNPHRALPLHRTTVQYRT